MQEGNVKVGKNKFSSEGKLTVVVESYGAKLSVISEIFTQMLTEFEDIRANQILSVTSGKRTLET